MRRALAVVLVLIGAGLRGSGQEVDVVAPRLLPMQLDKIILPPGFQISLYSEDVPDARSMALGSKGTLFVGTRTEGKVYAVVSVPTQGGVARQVITIASGLEMPNGLAFRDGTLYVTESARISRFDDIENHLTNSADSYVIYSDYPRERYHGWRYTAFGPDGQLYVSVGAPCNVCEPLYPICATISRINPDGTGGEIFARGVRNSLGFDWDPGAHVLWFTDNGRDGMGDNLPPDELNQAPRLGMNFGFPYCHGNGIADPEFNKGQDCSQFTAPALNLPAHVAPLGMRFYTGSQFPFRYREGIFIAEHGSWERSVPTGYRVTFVPMLGGKPQGYEVFAQGWLEGDKAWGRPVDVLQLPDGSLLVSDDAGGRIYQISYGRDR